MSQVFFLQAEFSWVVAGLAIKQKSNPAFATKDKFFQWLMG